MSIRRGATQIQYEVLTAIQEEQRVNGRVRRTRIQARVYISWRSLNHHLTILEERNMIEEDELRITPKGLEFVRRFQRLQALLSTGVLSDG